MFSLFETFIAVYETKSFTRAASQLFLSQPTVTVRIKKLEEELKVQLFTRGQHQEVVPTNSATLLYGKAQQQLKDYEELQILLHNQNLSKHSFKMAVSHSAATTIMPLIFKTISKELDQLDLEISMFDSEEVFKLVQNHQVHFGIIEKPIVDDATILFPLFSDELVLAGTQPCETFFIRESGSGVAHYTKTYLKENEIFPKNIVRMNNNDMIVAHIKAGLGASLISKRFVVDEIPYQKLDEKYHRLFYGLSFHDEHNEMVKHLIQQIKKIAE